MQVGGRRRAVTRNGVAAGSVWDTRMKMDAVKGGIRVFNGSESRDEEEGSGDSNGVRAYRKLRRNQSHDGVLSPAEKRKRRNWRPPEPVANGSLERSPIQLRKAKSELSNSPRIVRGSCEKGDKGVVIFGGGSENGEEAEEEEDEEIEIEMEGERKSFDDKEIDLPLERPKNNVEEEKKRGHQNEDENKKVEQVQELPVSVDVEKKPTLVIDFKSKAPEPVRQAPVEEVIYDSFESVSGTQNRMRNIVDLVMWRDISKSAFVFGFGSFLLISSSYAKEINFSLISAVSYVGLVYLALIFLYKSILRRGSTLEFDERDESCMVGEEEAIWVLRCLLPYINEVLLKIRALFSGDPATTMKLAVLLFVMARCGSSITVWTLARLGFFGVFTIPKVCSSYSVQLARYGKFWLERFRDGWESCTHKKAVAGAVFTLIWNLSSAVARVWAVFMLVVAVRFYQQCTVAEWNGEDDYEEEEAAAAVAMEEKRQQDCKAGQGPGRRHHRQMGGAGNVIGVKRETPVKAKKGA